MEYQLQNLIDIIHEEGLKKAKEESHLYLERKKREADQLLKKAQQDAEALRLEAQQVSERFEQSGKAALEQAARDVILGLQNQLQEMMKTILHQELNTVFSSEALAGILEKLVGAWGASQTQAGSAELLLDEKNWETLEKMLRARLSAHLAQGIELKPFPLGDSGFRLLPASGSGVAYDFTAARIADVLASYVNPKFVESLKKATAQK